jgi:hypothetical protein
MKLTAGCVLGLCFLVLVYYLHIGITTFPSEGDSLAYHIPVARMISSGEWMEPDAFEKPFYFYPAMGEALLSAMTGIGIPQNLFNVIGWVVLGLGVYGLSRRVSLNKESAVILSASSLMWPSVVRLLNNQTVDIWLAVWWTASVFWWEKSEMTKTQWVWLGIFMGMLCGIKVSGLLFAVVLLGAYVKKWTNLKRDRAVGFILALVGVGGFWYVRNQLLTGNPFYPATIFWWQGDSNFRLMEWAAWKTVFLYPNGMGVFVSAMVSEFLVWPVFLLAPLVIRNRWIGLGWLNFLVYLILPSWPTNVVSDLRYLFPAFIPLSVGVWTYVKGKKWEETLVILSVMSIAVEFAQLDFRPKLFSVAMLIPLLGWKFRRAK